MTRGSPQGDSVTPPLSSRDALPLTPPLTNEKNPTTVSQIVGTIERYKRGRHVPTERFMRFRIDKHQYQDLERELSEDEFFRNKLRRDYYPLQGLLVFRMPSRVHECFLVKVHDEIRHQLRSLNGASSSFAQDIAFEGSTTFIPSDPTYGPHDPDGSFRYRNEPFPGVVTEVAYSQEGKMLKDLADDYILGSDLEVRALVAFDIPYRKKAAARVSVWRARPLQEDGGEVWTTTSEVQVFRDGNGEAILDPNSGFRLHLGDFASAELCNTFDNLDGTIFLSCATLCTFLNDAESEKRVISSRPLLRKRRRTSTPDEELNTDDERNMVAAEERATKRADRDDSSFKDGLSSTTSGSG